LKIFKILFIAPSNSIHAYKWIKFFSHNNKYDVTWVSFYKLNNDFDTKNLKYIELSNFSIVKSFFRLKKLIKENNFEIIHLHYLGIKSYLVLFFNFKKLFISPWGSDLKLVKTFSLKFFLIKAILNKSNLTTIDAEFMRDEIFRFTNKKNNIVRINFGTDTEKFHFNSSVLEHKKLKIISLRNLETIYSLETLIKAGKILKKNKIDFKIDIYAEGNEKKKLNNLIEKLDLNNNISLMGRYNYEELPQLLSKYNLYVSTSTTDAGIAASTSEAMSSGMIVISADNSENKFWMSDKCGFLFKTKSEKDLVEQILKVQALPSSKITLIKRNARNKILKYNSYVNEMTKIAEYYEK
tara:strand:- start:228 stop:1283 length:1056 start_codon:yes stop_codon:yes gene_type:complete